MREQQLVGGTADGSAGRPGIVEQLVQPLGNQLSAFREEVRVAVDGEEGRVRRDALGLERLFPLSLDHGVEVLQRGLVADPPICLATQEGEVRDVVDLLLVVVSLRAALGKMWWN